MPTPEHAPLHQLGQPVGPPLGAWRPPALPSVHARSRLAAIEPLDAERHTAPLLDELLPAPPTLWTYLSIGPFDAPQALAGDLAELAARPGWLPFAIVVDGRAAGFASLLRIEQAHGVCEVGSICLGPSLQRTTAATEALWLVLANVFAAGYRRCEWKCDALNAPSRAAAERLGFAYEGTFRKATTYKGRSRDTAWYAIVDDDWPLVDAALQAWLRPDNFDAGGRQRTGLVELRRQLGSPAPR